MRFRYNLLRCRLHARFYHNSGGQWWAYLIASILGKDHREYYVRPLGQFIPLVISVGALLEISADTVEQNFGEYHRVQEST